MNMTTVYKIPRSVLVVIHTPDLQVLMMERAGWPGFWQSVTGSVAHEAEPRRSRSPRPTATRSSPCRAGAARPPREAVEVAAGHRLVACWRHALDPHRPVRPPGCPLRVLRAPRGPVPAVLRGPRARDRDRDRARGGIRVGQGVGRAEGESARRVGSADRLRPPRRVHPGRTQLAGPAARPGRRPGRAKGRIRLPFLPAADRGDD